MASFRAHSCTRFILVPRAYDPSGLADPFWRQESRALEQPFQACAIDADYVRPDGQNSVISFVISKWLLPELSIPAAGQKDRRLWGREWHTHTKNMADLPWYWALSVEKWPNLTNQHGHPTFCSSRCNELIMSFAWEKTNLISMAEHWINKENADKLWSFLFCHLVTMWRNLVQILIKTSAFCLNQTYNVYLCSTQCSDCSLMRVLMGLGHKVFQLLLGMSYSNMH